MDALVNILVRYALEADTDMVSVYASMINASELSDAHRVTLAAVGVAL